MIVVHRNDGVKVAHQVSGTSITFADELTLNLARYQRDWHVRIDICSNKDNMLVVGAAAGLRYVAQLEIPATAYAASAESSPAATAEGQGPAPHATPEPLPLDMGAVTLTLWSLEGGQPHE